MRIRDIETKPNINTIILVAGFVITLVATLGGWLWYAAGKDQQINQIQRDFNAYTTSHADLHKDRNVAISAFQAEVNTRLNGFDNNAAEMRRIVDNHEFRTTVLEAGAANLSTTVSEIKTEMGEIKADIRLTNQRLEQVIGLLGGTPRGQQ